MANLNQLLRSEITRLARKESTASVTGVHKSTAHLRRDVAALKRIVVALQKANRVLQAALDKVVAAQPTSAPEEGTKARITGKGVRSLRRKLRLSQADFGRLIGVTAQAVVNMEKKNDPLAVRKVTRAAILAIRGIGAREAKAKLAEIKPMEKKAPAKLRGKRG